MKIEKEELDLIVDQQMENEQHAKTSWVVGK